MATNAVKLAQRTSNRSLFNKLIHCSNRTLSTIGKWNFHPSSIPALTLNHNNSNHICSATCCHHLFQPNTISHRSMSTTQDKNNDEPEEENEEAEDDEVESEESDNESSSQQVTELQNKIGELEKEVAKYKDALARSHADIINIQNMSKKDVESTKKFAIKGFSKDMLNVADSLDGCINVVETHLNDYKHEDNKLDENIKSVIEGVKITQGTLMDTFGRHGITKMKSLHEEFDPNVHEALFKQPTNEHPEDHVVTVISEGYTIKDAVLRAAKVGVSTPDPTQQNDDANKDNE
eukprot:CAMPEP_0201585598 /NCGR_PEP_ID=MMETSP0190_2-20130828/123785_1 /ASSEMBLY_ACC=CAM_ASM_000263 /TAXON_ID=37353 /ORGANISM="Rosalina sp." /LENGTH=291 /DNA_ID=CAMNT_0048031867 /DNA_START=32 /DNA_END=907 /DNA_ORIENTATION=+